MICRRKNNDSQQFLGRQIVQFFFEKETEIRSRNKIYYVLEFTSLSINVIKVFKGVKM